ncbi:MAG TPA: ferrochelatase [Caulobacteraceae bacterium]|jgi:ferrochelatase|nr:ferrochelatase [Caulobacteraceae bacterium]
MAGRGRRIAVVLFNLGGPKDLDEVEPFLKNLFSDPAIIDLPGFLRRPLADFIARSRARTARANYQAMGGGSPLLAETKVQAGALSVELAKRGVDARMFIAMRYWSPSIEAAAGEVAQFGATDVVLTPLYPQFSITTTDSSLKAWRAAYKGPGEMRSICCWPRNEGLIAAHVEAIGEVWRNASQPPVRLLFSAHGIPIRTARRGDPYAWQIETTCRAIAERLGSGWDWQVCYQSRVGPLEWLGPSTPEAIRQAARDGIGVLIDPVSFVSEHVETLIELDRDYAVLAREAGASCYLRAPTMGVRPKFIEGLATAILERLERPGTGPEGIACPAGYGRCVRDGKEAA